MTEERVTVVFDGKVLRPETPLKLRPDMRYVVTILDQLPLIAIDAWDVLDALTGVVEAPEDWASEHDRYLYGISGNTDVITSMRFAEMQ